MRSVIQMLRRRHGPRYWLALLCLLAALTGCGQQTEQQTAAAPPDAAPEEAQAPEAAQAPEKAQAPEEARQAQEKAQVAEEARAPEETALSSRPGEPDARRRKLDPAELEALRGTLRSAEYGFFTCTYARPEEIDWNVVLHDGAGLSAGDDSALRAACQARGWDFGQVRAAVPLDALEAFVRDRTGTDYAVARVPLYYPAWEQLSDGTRWYWLRVDDGGADGDGEAADGGSSAAAVPAAAAPDAFTDGYVNGTEYVLCYDRADPEYRLASRPFVMRCRIDGGQWQYVSNLPADAPAPLTLLDIRLCETKEEAAALGITDFVEIEARPSDEPYGWCWAVITARTEGVRCIVDRTDEAFDYDRYFLILPGENICSRVLRAGEGFALYVNQPWHPGVLLTATKDAYWGQYIFGEDNGLHLDNSVPRYVTGHDLQGEGRGCAPETEAQLARFLRDDTWAALDQTTGEFYATLQFTGEGELWLGTGETSYPFLVRYGDTDTGAQTGTEEDAAADAEAAAAWQAPDVLTLERSAAGDPDWSALPERFDGPACGSYCISATQLDCLQILYLTPLDAGGDALSALVPGLAGESGTLQFFRCRGAVQMEGQG